MKRSRTPADTRINFRKPLLNGQLRRGSALIRFPGSIRPLHHVAQFFGLIRRQDLSFGDLARDVSAHR